MQSCYLVELVTQHGVVAKQYQAVSATKLGSGVWEINTIDGKIINLSEAGGMTVIVTKTAQPAEEKIEKLA